MPIDFMKFYNAKTAVDDIRSDVEQLSKVLSYIDSELSTVRRLIKGERRLMAKGGGGSYEYIRFTYFNYVIDVHVTPPLFELNALMSTIRDKLMMISNSLNKAISVIEKMGDDVKNLGLIGVIIEDGETKLLLIP
ncbi:hypothetical protein [Caldivirga maquilingensis]|uniref:Uncharacterized protein n=1 Tax=Caldivirga maquilingensis (strain ATCC 700844 / DSM 13496 / JCM 10307 / IC-167) TaxID=397948 RepID=A8M9V0_CALMQ|nr:hypothetical protein [Caldivirga maquilingensis]ABW02421.1 hypothetical protein Cmaq_1598 [Caldivirga maquilingensis IC-167]